MAAPNLLAPTTITGVTYQQAITNSDADVLTAAASHTYKINSIYVANIDGSSAADVTITFTPSGGSALALCSTVSVAADSSLVVVDKTSPLYLAPGDKLRSVASASGDLVMTISYEDIS